MHFEQAMQTASVPSSLTAKLLHNKKRAAAFAAVLFIGSFLLNALSGVLAPGLALFIQTAGFSGLGYLHYLILRANVTALTADQKIWYSLLLSLVVALGGYVFYFLFSNPFVLTVITGVCTFLLPFVLDEVWRLFLILFTRAAATWHYSTDVSVQKATTFLNSIPVRFKIDAGRLRGEYTVSFKAPVRMKLGTIFYHMVQEQNSHREDVIELTDREGQAYDWAFSTSVLGWKSFLDPELTLLENGIKENAVVKAERMSKEDLLQEARMENG